MGEIMLVLDGSKWSAALPPGKEPPVPCKEEGRLASELAWMFWRRKISLSCSYP